MNFDISVLSVLLKTRNRMEFAAQCGISSGDLLMFLRRIRPAHPEVRCRIAEILSVPIEAIFDEAGYCRPVAKNKWKPTLEIPVDEITGESPAQRAQRNRRLREKRERPLSSMSRRQRAAVKASETLTAETEDRNNV